MKAKPRETRTRRERLGRSPARRSRRDSRRRARRKGATEHIGGEPSYRGTTRRQKIQQRSKHHSTRERGLIRFAENRENWSQPLELGQPRRRPAPRPRPGQRPEDKARIPRLSCARRANMAFQHRPDLYAEASALAHLSDSQMFSRCCPHRPSRLVR